MKKSINILLCALAIIYTHLSYTADNYSWAPRGAVQVGEHIITPQSSLEKAATEVGFVFSQAFQEGIEDAVTSATGDAATKAAEEAIQQTAATAAEGVSKGLSWIPRGAVQVGEHIVTPYTSTLTQPIAKTVAKEATKKVGASWAQYFGGKLTSGLTWTSELLAPHLKPVTERGTKTIAALSLDNPNVQAVIGAITLLYLTKSLGYDRLVFSFQNKLQNALTGLAKVSYKKAALSNAYNLNDDLKNALKTLSSSYKGPAKEELIKGWQNKINVETLDAALSVVGRELDDNMRIRAHLDAINELIKNNEPIDTQERAKTLARKTKDLANQIKKTYSWFMYPTGRSYWNQLNQQITEIDNQIKLNAYPSDIRNALKPIIKNLIRLNDYWTQSAKGSFTPFGLLG